MRLSVAMMAHPARAASVERILSALDRIDVPVVWDRKNDRHDTGRRAMLSYDPEADYHAVIQDDVLVCRDLCAGLERALDYLPADVPLCGYASRVLPYRRLIDKALQKHRHTHISWLTMHTLNWGPLVVVPTDAIPDMIAHYDALTGVPNYDRRLSRYWSLVRRSRIWYTWPSLVDHADGPSLVEGRGGTDRTRTAGRPRVAHTFLGEDASALDVDWSGEAVNLSAPGTPRLRVDHPPIFRRDRVPVGARDGER